MVFKALSASSRAGLAAANFSSAIFLSPCHLKQMSPFKIQILSKQNIVQCNPHIDSLLYPHTCTDELNIKVITYLNTYINVIMYLFTSNYKHIYI